MSSNTGAGVWGAIKKGVLPERGGGGGGGGTLRTILSISSNTLAGSTASTDYIYLCSGTITLTLPTAIGNSNRYTIKNVGVGTITVAFSNGQTGDGSTTLTLSVANQSIDLISDNSNWNLI